MGAAQKAVHRLMEMEAPRAVIAVLEGFIANTQLSKNDPLLHVRLKKLQFFLIKWKLYFLEC